MKLLHGETGALPVDEYWMILERVAVVPFAMGIRRTSRRRKKQKEYFANTYAGRELPR
jgi:hypothetical protein